MSGRGEEISRPQPWVVRAADRQAFQGWQRLLTVAVENLDRAWVALTSDPRRAPAIRNRPTLDADRDR